jgi:hypothetical protein
MRLQHRHTQTPRSKSLEDLGGKRRWHGNGGETSNDNATSPRDKGDLEQHAQKCTDHSYYKQRAAASAHPQAGPDRSPPAPMGLNKQTNPNGFNSKTTEATHKQTRREGETNNEMRGDRQLR